jgi:hypothetical protein
VEQDFSSCIKFKQRSDLSVIDLHFTVQRAKQLVFSGSFARFVQSSFCKIRWAGVPGNEGRLDYLLVGDNAYYTSVKGFFMDRSLRVEMA